MPEMDFLQQFKNFFAEPDHLDGNHTNRVLALAGLVNNADYVVYFRREANQVSLVAGWNLPCDFVHDANHPQSHAAVFLENSELPFQQIEDPANFPAWAEDKHLRNLDLKAIWLIDLGSHELGRGVLALYFNRLPKRIEEGLGSLQQCAAILRFEEERRLFQNSSKPYLTKSEAIVEGISLADATQPKNPLVFTNPGFEKMTGYTLQEVTGRNCKFLQGPDTDPKTVARLSQALRNQESIRVEIINYRKDQKPFWNLLSIQPVFDSEGQLRFFLGLQLDITNWREAQNTPEMEASIGQHTQAPEPSEEHGVAVFDKHGKLTAADSTTLEMFGYASQAEVAKHHLYHFIANMDEQLMQHRLETLDKSPFPLQLLGKLGLRQDGNFFPLSYSLRHMPGSTDGQLIALFKDLSQDQLKATEANRQALRSEHSQRIKAQLLDAMSHSMRTKLHAMLSYSKFGMRKLNDAADGQIRDYFTSINVSGDQLITYIDHLLALAHLGSEPKLFRAMRQDISLIIDNTLNQFDRHLLHKKINLEYTVDVLNSHVWVDSTSIGQILYQVLDRTIQSCHSGDFLNIQLLQGVIRSEGSRHAALALNIGRNQKDRPTHSINEPNFSESLGIHPDISIALAQTVVSRYGGQLEYFQVSNNEHFTLRLPLLPAM